MTRWLMIIVVAAIQTGCATRYYTLTKQGGRDLLLPYATAATPSCGAAPGSPRAAHFAVYGCYVQAGFVDLQPGMRLRIVKPILAAGEKPRLETSTQNDRTIAVKSNIVGVDTQIVEASSLGFGPETTSYRLFFLARDLGRERKITLIGAPTKADLDTATATLETYCQQPRATCLAVSEGMVIAPLIPVTINGKADHVPLGAQLFEALPKGIDSKRLRLMRNWKNKRIEVRAQGTDAPALTSLPLNGGDAITW